MKIVLYKNNADNRVVDKTSHLEKIVEFNGAMFKQNVSIMDVSIIIQFPNETTIMGANYIYIPELSIYYYVTDVRFLSGGRVEFSCREDVLMTYKKDILKLRCVIARQENNYNVYLDDDKFRVYSNKRIQTKLFPNGFDKNNCSYILTIAGGD